jgi:hypothetical protein
MLHLLLEIHDGLVFTTLFVRSCYLNWSRGRTGTKTSKKLHVIYGSLLMHQTIPSETGNNKDLELDSGVGSYVKRYGVLL